MPSLSRDGVRLAYTDAGGGAPPLVFIHGAACDRGVFAAQRAHFEPRTRVVTVDLRGHGESDAPNERYSIALWAADLAWLLERLGARDCVLVGHSMGAVVALKLAAARPDAARAVVAIDPSPLVITDAFRAAVGPITAALASGDRGPLNQLVDVAWFSPGTDPALRRAIVDGVMSRLTHVLLAVFDAILASDALRSARAARVPIVHVAPDAPINDPAAVERLLPGIRQERVPGTGHFVMLEAPERINGLIAETLSVSA